MCARHDLFNIKQKNEKHQIRINSLPSQAPLKSHHHQRFLCLHEKRVNNAVVVLCTPSASNWRKGEKYKSQNGFFFSLPLFVVCFYLCWMNDYDTFSLLHSHYVLFLILDYFQLDSLSVQPRVYYFLFYNFFPILQRALSGPLLLLRVCVVCCNVGWIDDDAWAFHELFECIMLRLSRMEPRHSVAVTEKHKGIAFKTFIVIRSRIIVECWYWRRKWKWAREGKSFTDVRRAWRLGDGGRIVLGAKENTSVNVNDSTLLQFLWVSTSNKKFRHYENPLSVTALTRTDNCDPRETIIKIANRFTYFRCGWVIMMWWLSVFVSLTVFMGMCQMENRLHSLTKASMHRGVDRCWLKASASSLPTERQTCVLYALWKIKIMCLVYIYFLVESNNV